MIMETGERNIWNSSLKAEIWCDFFFIVKYILNLETLYV